MTVNIEDLERRLVIAEHALTKYLAIDLGAVEDSLNARARGAAEPAPGEHVAGSIPDPPPAQPAAETPVEGAEEPPDEGEGGTDAPPAEDDGTDTPPAGDDAPPADPPDGPPAT